MNFEPFQHVEKTFMPASDQTSPLVLVTGGAGFIGSHTVDRLVERGARVVVFDDFSTGRHENLVRWLSHPSLTIVEADISDGLFAPLSDVVRDQGPISHVIHLAARTAVVKSVFNPFRDIRNNYVGVVQVLEYAWCTGVQKVIFASSSAVYDDDGQLPTAETSTLRPISPYGIDKLGGEAFCDYYARVRGLRSTVFRFFNVYGPRQDPKSPYSGVISIFAHRAIEGLPLLIYGDGQQTRDFVYVGDVARALVEACFTDSCDGAIINLGSAIETSINDLARLTLGLAGSRSIVEHAPARPGEIRRSVANIGRAQRLLSFEPSMLLRCGLTETLRWMKADSQDGSPGGQTTLLSRERWSSSLRWEQP